MARTFERILHSMVDNENVLVSQLQVFGQHDQKQISEWNAIEPVAVQKCIHEIFQQRVLECPTAQAVDAWDCSLTYLELDQLSTQMSHHLAHLGVKPEVVVPLCFNKSAWIIVAIMGVLKAGGACVLLDPQHPQSRIVTTVKAVDAKVVIAGPEQATFFDDLVDTIISLDEDYLSKPLEVSEVDINAASSSNLAFVIFTSGSTGTPKGILMDHTATATSCEAHGSKLKVSQSTRILQFAAYTFDIAMLDICVALTRGACLCIPSEHDRFNRLAAFINEKQVNWADLTPSVANILAPSSVPTLKTLALAGEAITKTTTDIWVNEVDLNNCYGPAETSITSWKGEVGKSGNPSNIGHAISSLIWIVDPSDHNQLAPVGCIGEICVEGPMVARSYLNAPEKTMEVFIENPTWGKILDSGKSRRVYKTGDLARYNPDGTMDYLGRQDTQVKMRGQRIELGEIESHIMSKLVDILNVAVEKVTPPGRRDGLLAAFYSRQDNSANGKQPSSITTDLSEAEVVALQGLRKLLADSLPSYMIPSMFVQLQHMPMTASGKIDRGRLRQITSEFSSDQVSHYLLSQRQKQKPSTDMERSLQELWAKALDVDPSMIGAGDDFFEVGGDSVGAMRLVGVARTVGFTITVANIFHAPRLDQMAKLVTVSDEIISSHVEPFELLGDDESKQKLLTTLQTRHGIAQNAVVDAYPCTALQRGLMLISVRQQGTYVVQVVFRLDPGIDMARFKFAWELVFERHPILRTIIINMEDSGAIQAILKDDIRWRTGDTLQLYLKEDKQSAMDYGDNLTRYGLVGSGTERYFVWTAHHAVYDGWSVPLILGEVERIYQLQRAPGPAPTPYSAFIGHVLRTDMAAAEEFWRNQLHEVPLSTYPQERPESFEPFADVILTHEINLERPIGARHTVSTLIRAAWGIIVAEYAGSDNIVFGAMLSGRNIPVEGITEMTGPTITTIPIRVSLDRQQSIAELLTNIQTQAADANMFEHMGLNNIKLLSPEADKICEFQNLLLIHPAHASKSDGPVGPTFWRQENIAEAGMEEHLQYPIVLDFWLGEGKIDLQATHDARLVPTGQMQRILNQFEHVMRQLNACSETIKVNDIEIFSPQDRQEMLARNSIFPPAVDACIHDIISTRVTSKPNSLAVHSWDGNLTYTELHHYSTRLAHHLVSLGITPETFVAMCFDKSCWAIVAMLAVLKAGGAYVSLNPSHPISRNKYIITDVKATVMLTDSKHHANFTGITKNTVSVDRTFVEGLPHIDGAPCQIPSSNPAFAVFTSGSTGMPKGIIMEHGAFATSAKAHSAALGINSDSRVMQFAAYTYDVSMGEIFTTLMQGGCICVPSEEERLNNLGGVITDMNVNWLFLTPTVAGLLDPATVPTLRTLVLGGEHCTTENIATWADHVNLINSYGPAECAIWTSCAPKLKVGADPSNLGRNIGGLLWVANIEDYNKLTPLGCVGELLIEGPVLGRGYLNDLKKTAAAFIEAPVWLPANRPEHCKRVYRTGDLVRYEMDGTLTVVGRKDSQTKLNGQRLELGEVEHHLWTGLNVKNAMAILPKTGFCKGRLTAIVSFQDFVPPGGNAGGRNYLRLIRAYQRERALELLTKLRTHMSSNVPGYMVPTLWIMVETVPLNVSGKMDRSLVSKWVTDMSQETYTDVLEKSTEKTLSVKPTTDMEKNMQILWGKALIVDPETISANDNFLSLGGDSISAMRLTAFAKAVGIVISIANIFLHPILADMSMAAKMDVEEEAEAKVYAAFSGLPASISSEIISTVTSSQSKCKLENIEDILPATDYQSWALICGHLKSRGYNNYFSFRLDGAIDVTALQKACNLLVARHPVLRTIFHVHKRQVLQVVLKSYDLEFKYYDSKREKSGFLGTLIQKDQKRQVKLGEGIVRFMLVKEAQDQHRLIMRMSHAQYDGISLPIIVGDLKAGYLTQELSTSAKFSEFVYPTLDKQTAASSSFWSNLLRGSSMTDIVLYKGPPHRNVTNKMALRTVTCPQLSARGVTFATTIKAAWAYVLAAVSHRPDVVFGQISTGRTAPVAGIQRAVGPCLNILPVRVKLQSSWSAKDLLQHVQDQYIRSLEYENHGFRDIIENCTDWPKWTRFSSILQHTNLGDANNFSRIVVPKNVGTKAKLVAAGDVNFHLETVAPPHDVADIWIWSYPNGDDEFTFQFDYNTELISEAFANETINLLERTIKILCVSTSEQLPPPATVLHRGKTHISIPLEYKPPVHVPDFDSSMQSAKRPELLVKRAWDIAFASNPIKRPARFSSDTPFFEVWGDLAVAAQLANFYQDEEKLAVSIEDIIENPTMSKQIQLLTKGSKAKMFKNLIKKPLSAAVKGSSIKPK